jgi:hypothetical protein
MGWSDDAARNRESGPSRTPNTPTARRSLRGTRGASIWVDPYRWIPEAARLLRSGGRLVFLCNSTLVILCSPDEGRVTETLQRPQRGMSRFKWEGGVEFHLSHGERIEVLRANGFELERLVELYPPDDAEDHPYYDFVGAEWAKQWPAEEIWVAHKR